MLKINDITIDLKDEFNELRKGITMSFYSFTSIFMSRDCTYYKYARVRGGIAIVCLPPGGKSSCMFPLGADDLGAAVAELRETLGDFTFIPLTYCMKQKLSQTLGAGIEFSRNVDYSDYIYDTQQMIELSGKPYHSKRNFITRFSNRYDYEYLPITSANVAETMPLMEKWFAEHPGYKSEMFDESAAILELVRNFDALGVKGAALRVDGDIVAVSFGELLTPEMAHILIEKGDTTYPGVYPVINRDFLQNEWSDTKFVNREEDMGLEGLRKAKESYHPAYKNEVYIGRFN